MAEKSREKKAAADDAQGEQGQEELLRHPVMAFPPFAPVLVTAQRVPFYAEPDESSKVVGEARMKEVVPVLEAQGPWLMTVCKFEEAWFQAAYVERVEQDAPTVTFKDQEVVHQAFEEKQDSAEPGRKVPTETAAYMDQADGYGMMVMPGSTEELFAQAYAELVYAFEPNAEMIGTYAHIMNVFSPDTVVELQDFIAIPAQVEAGGKTGAGPAAEREQDGGAKRGAARGVDRLRPSSPVMAMAMHGAQEELDALYRELGTLREVAPQVAAMAQASWGEDVGAAKVVEDASLEQQGKRGAVADAATIRVAPGQAGDVELMLEEAAHLVQHENGQGGQQSEDAPREVGALEAEAQQAVEAALAGKRFPVVGVASSELNDDGQAGEQPSLAEQMRAAGLPEPEVLAAAAESVQVKAVDVEALQASYAYLESFGLSALVLTSALVESPHLMSEDHARWLARGLEANRGLMEGLDPQLRSERLSVILRSVRNDSLSETLTWLTGQSGAFSAFWANIVLGSQEERLGAVASTVPVEEVPGDGPKLSIFVLYPERARPGWLLDVLLKLQHLTSAADISGVGGTLIEEVVHGRRLSQQAMLRVSELLDELIADPARYAHAEDALEGLLVALLSGGDEATAEAAFREALASVPPSFVWRPTLLSISTTAGGQHARLIEISPLARDVTLRLYVAGALASGGPVEFRVELDDAQAAMLVVDSAQALALVEQPPAEIASNVRRIHASGIADGTVQMLARPDDASALALAWSLESALATPETRPAETPDSSLLQREWSSLGEGDLSDDIAHEIGALAETLGVFGDESDRVRVAILMHRSRAPLALVTAAAGTVSAELIARLAAVPVSDPVSTVLTLRALSENGALVDRTVLRSLIDAMVDGGLPISQLRLALQAVGRMPPEVTWLDASARAVVVRAIARSHVYPDALALDAHLERLRDREVVSAGDFEVGSHGILDEYEQYYVRWLAALTRASAVGIALDESIVQGLRHVLHSGDGEALRIVWSSLAADSAAEAAKLWSLFYDPSYTAEVTRDDLTMKMLLVPRLAEAAERYGGIDGPLSTMLGVIEYFRDRGGVTGIERFILELKESSPAEARVKLMRDIVQRGASQ